MFGLFDDNEKYYDYKRLRRDLSNEFGAQGAGFSGGFGFIQMMEAESASEEELLRIAKREGVDLKKYRK